MAPNELVLGRRPFPPVWTDPGPSMTQSVVNHVMVQSMAFSKNYVAWNSALSFAIFSKAHFPKWQLQQWRKWTKMHQSSLDAIDSKAMPCFRHFYRRRLVELNSRVSLVTMNVAPLSVRSPPLELNTISSPLSPPHLMDLLAISDASACGHCRRLCLAVFFCCWCPFVTVELYDVFHQLDYNQQSVDGATFVILLRDCSAALYPLIYLIMAFTYRWVLVSVATVRSCWQLNS